VLQIGSLFKKTAANEEFAAVFTFEEYLAIVGEREPEDNPLRLLQLSE
jgi:hypothetical protein